MTRRRSRAAGRGSCRRRFGRGRGISKEDHDLKTSKPRPWREFLMRRSGPLETNAAAHDLTSQQKLPTPHHAIRHSKHGGNHESPAQSHCRIHSHNQYRGVEGSSGNDSSHLSRIHGGKSSLISSPRILGLRSTTRQRTTAFKSFTVTRRTRACGSCRESAWARCSRQGGGF